MARTTPKGLYVWDLGTDQFSHSQLAANWDLVDSLLDVAAKSVETRTTLPGTGNFAGRLVMLSASDGGFPAWTLVRYDGSAWKNAGAIEVLPSLPTLNNHPGRVVVLSAAVSGFSAWDVVRYDGSAWDILGGWRKADTGGLATNIRGLQTTGDVYVSDSARGFVMVDRATGTKRRVFFNNGNFTSEVVS